MRPFLFMILPLIGAMVMRDLEWAFSISVCIWFCFKRNATCESWGHQMELLFTVIYSIFWIFCQVLIKRLWRMFCYGKLQQWKTDTITHARGSSTLSLENYSLWSLSENGAIIRHMLLICEEKHHLICILPNQYMFLTVDRFFGIFSTWERGCVTSLFLCSRPCSRGK